MPKKTAPVRITQSATRLKEALKPQEFAKHIKHIPQHALVSLSIGSLNRLLVSRGILTQLEIQQAFLDEAEIKGF